jgi:hypothetical protein
MFADETERFSVRSVQQQSLSALRIADSEQYNTHQLFDS